MSRFSMTAALALLLLAQAAQAELYRCQQGGTTVFSDKPCAKDAQPYQPEHPIQVVPHIQAPDLAKKYDEDVQRGKKDRDQADSKWNKDYQTRKEQEQRLKQAHAKRKVVAGMTAREVRSLLGEPVNTNRSESAKGVKESWTYMDNGARLTVSFKDGVVTGTTHHKGRKK
ncbi:MAG: DUF4124 domain-containing protein [Stenotrophobium sp.]